MKTSFKTILAASLWCATASIPARAQTEVPAPAGWTTQTKAGGAVTYTPPNLAVSEIYSITLYDSAPMDGQTLEAYLRDFAGPVGTGAGKLRARLQIKAQNAGVTSGFGAYSGPNGADLGAVFYGVSLDGATIRALRVLFSSDDLFINRYKAELPAILESLAQRTRDEAGERTANVPQKALGNLTPGGAIVPGVYAGERFTQGKLSNRFRLHIYPDGQFRLCDENDKDIQTTGFNERVGQVSYNRVTGELTVDSLFDLANGYDYQHCYYGRDAANQPMIYNTDGVAHSVTELRYVGANTKRLAPKAEHARQAAIKAEEKRYKFVVVAGQGVKAAQIQTVLHFYNFGFGGYFGSDVTDEAYLLLRDGTVHQGLPVAPDQLDVAASRAKEPKTWGKWRKVGAGYQVSWVGGPWEELKGQPTVAGTPQMRLEGRYAAVRASIYWHQFWGVTFDKTGRFSKDRRGGVSVGPGVGGIEGSVTATTTWDEGGASSTTSVAGGATTTGGTLFSSSSKNKNPNGDRQGTYSIDGYTLTLRYDNGQVVRMPFFFTDATRKQLWFEGDTLELGLDN